MSKRSPPASTLHQRRGHVGNLKSIDTDRRHLTGPFVTQTPLDSATPESSYFPVPTVGRQGSTFWSDLKSWRWVVNPVSSFKLLAIPVILYFNWELVAQNMAPGLSNPFSPLLFISYPVGSDSVDVRYAKGYLDLVFLAYYIIFFSFVRQVIIIHVCHRVARYLGIKREGILDRFGEQGYALIYFAIMGAWGYRIMGQLPTYWFRTEYFWIGYPQWEMKPELKRYYLMHMAYWCQQLIVLLLGLEKPRKDYQELVVHHIVTLWLIGWSYLVNLTLIGNAVYMSMDIPDAFLAFSKLLNYIKLERAKFVSFVVFIAVWTYFRHYLNFVILWSVWTEFDLVPEVSRVWAPPTGAWLVWWMKYQIFAPILLLQMLNLFWYYLIWRIAIRSITSTLTDDRSDDEDNDGDADDINEKDE
ncbi:longevity assurance proteins LAG1 LAC1 [Pisolithus orientalis]|uniref:longevity assurance proteins LAG1 LAC1 n=1 Tax=Pisolithus orientalis TaxID=936130 RepID=UPI0022256E46|nr:longevity assurance proteins LAG1 LAC1 [Pisolithus orientalis]KAI6035161.1 longevity assurance proteins LAG1 LAC1 [Pisolithus orientalis]